MYSYWINTKIVTRQRGSFPLPASGIGGAKVLLYKLHHLINVLHVKKSDIL
jgi:hypothetical protein